MGPGPPPRARLSRRAPRAKGTLNVKRRVIQPRGRAGQGGGRAPLRHSRSPRRLLAGGVRAPPGRIRVPGTAAGRGAAGECWRAWSRDLPLCPGDVSSGRRSGGSPPGPTPHAGPNPREEKCP